MKNCKTVFPQTSGYLKYRSKGKGGGGALLRRMVLNRGGLLLIACSDSTAVEA